MIRFLFLSILFVLASTIAFSQEDLLAMLEERADSSAVEYVEASFKTNRVVNLHSLENTAAGVLDFKIGHRFGFVNGGIREFFGLDGATIRLGFDYGVTDRFVIGLGRSSFEKTVDGYMKYKILRQSKGARNTPITLAYFVSTAVKTLPFAIPDRENLGSSRWYFTHQIIMGRKFSEGFTLQLSPTLVHRNLVSTSTVAHDVFAVGVAARQKLSKRFSLNIEYIYTLPDQLADAFTNSFSVGVDIETGGHVFQLHFTNSTSMIEKGFIAENVGEWSRGGIHFGFNVSRVFTLHD